MAISAPLPSLSLSGHLGVLAGDPSGFPTMMKFIPIVSLADLDPCYFENESSIQSFEHSTYDL